MDHHLLRQEDLLRRDLHPQVPARDHDSVRLFEDRVKVLQALLVLDLADDLDARALGAEHPADQVEVRALPHKGGGDEVDVVGHAPVAEVPLVLLRERRQVDDDAGQVDVFALPERRVVEASGLDGPRCDVRGNDLEDDRPVRAEDLRAGRDVLRQLLVRHRDESGPPFRLVVGRDGDLVARRQADRLLVLEEARADFGAFRVEHDGAHDAGVLAGDAEGVEGLLRLLIVVVWWSVFCCCWSRLSFFSFSLSLSLSLSLRLGFDLEGT